MQLIELHPDKEMNRRITAERIVNALNNKGAGLGDCGRIIVQKVLEDLEVK